MRLFSGFFAIFALLLTFAPLWGAAKDSLSLEDKNKARRDLNILLGLPEESHLIPPMKTTDSLPTAEYVSQYKKGLLIYENAVKTFQSGDFEKALELFQQTIAIFPLHKNAFSYIVKTLRYINRSRNADYVVGQEEDAKTIENDNKFAAGLNEYLKQNYAGAVKLWSALAQTAPGYAKAFEYIRKAEDKIDEISENFVNQGLYFFQKGEPEKALAEWERGLLLCPDNDKLKMQIETVRGQAKIKIEGVLTQADARCKEKKYEEASRLLNDALSQFPDSKPLKDKLQETSRFLEKALNDKFNEAKALFDSRKFAEAIAKLNELLAINPAMANAVDLAKKAQDKLSAEEKQTALADLFKEAQSALDRQQFYEALDRLRLIEKDDPAYPGLKEKIKAATDGTAGVELRKKSASAFNRGLDFFNSGLILNALKEWKAILKDDPNNDMIKSYVAEAERLSKSESEDQKKKYQRESEVMKLSQSGLESLKKKNFPEAIQNLEQASEFDPDNAAVRKTLKTCRKEFAKEQDKRTPETEKKVESLFLEGINLYRDGQYKKAIECWKQVISLKPDHKKAQTYITNVSQKLQKIESI